MRKTCEHVSAASILSKLYMLYVINNSQMQHVNGMRARIFCEVIHFHKKEIKSECGNFTEDGIISSNM